MEPGVQPLLAVVVLVVVERVDQASVGQLAVHSLGHHHGHLVDQVEEL